MAVKKAPTTEETKTEQKTPVAKMRVMLSTGKSFSRAGVRYVPNTVYEVPEDLGDALLNIEVANGVSAFTEATKKASLGLQVVEINGSAAKPAVANGPIEIGTTDAEIEAKFAQANVIDTATGEGGAAGTGTDAESTVTID